MIRFLYFSMKSITYQHAQARNIIFQNFHDHDEDWFPNRCEIDSPEVDSVEDMQIILKELGYYEGEIDNLGGKVSSFDQTSDAVKQFIKDWNRENPEDIINGENETDTITSYVTPEIMKRLQYVALKKQINWELNELKDRFKKITPQNIQKKKKNNISRQ